MSKPRLLSGIVKSISDPVFGKKSTLYGQLVSNWRAIAGADLAEYSVPLELKFTRKPGASNSAILKLAVPGARVPEVMMQKDILILKLNQYMGFKAIEDIKLVHSHTSSGNRSNKKRVQPPLQKPLRPHQEQNLDQHLENVKNNDLKSALAGLGRAVYARQNAIKPLKNNNIEYLTEAMNEN